MQVNFPIADDKTVSTFLLTDLRFLSPISALLWFHTFLIWQLVPFVFSLSLQMLRVAAVCHRLSVCWNMCKAVASGGSLQTHGAKHIPQRSHYGLEILQNTEHWTCMEGRHSSSAELQSGAGNNFAWSRLLTAEQDFADILESIGQNRGSCRSHTSL